MARSSLTDRATAGPALMKSRESGAALVAVLAMAALVAAIALEVAYLARLEGDAAEEARGRGAATLLAWTGTTLAIETLSGDDPAYDGAGEPWTRPFTWRDEDGGEVVVTIEDESGRLPLQDLHDSDGRLDIAVKTRLDRLVAALGLPASTSDRLVDYADPDDARFPNGAETPEYRALTPARRPANRRPWSLEEIGRVYGLDETVAARLADAVTFWGGPRVNVNAASAPVLASLAPGLSLVSADRLVLRRDWTPFRRVDEATTLVALPSSARADFEAATSVGTSVFRITARATAYGRTVILVSIVERQSDGFAVKYRRLS